MYESREWLDSENIWEYARKKNIIAQQDVKGQSIWLLSVASLIYTPLANISVHWISVKATDLHSLLEAKFYIT
jgi:hypothetical protein